MKFTIVSIGLFISAAIMFSAAYITSAIIRSGTVGQSVLTPQTQLLHIGSICIALLAVTILAIEYFKKY